MDSNSKGGLRVSVRSPEYRVGPERVKCSLDLRIVNCKDLRMRLCGGAKNRDREGLEHNRGKAR